MKTSGKGRENLPEQLRIKELCKKKVSGAKNSPSSDHIREQKHFNLESVKFTFLFSCIEHVFRRFSRRAR